MPDVVGTALVRVKALTDQLAKDIEKGIKKGMKDAKLDKAAKEEGEKFGEDFGESVADSTEKTLKDRSKDMVPRDELNKEFGGVVKDAQKQFKQLDLGDAFDQLNGDFRENFSQLEIEFPEIDDIEFDVNADTDPATNSLLALQNRIRDLDLDFDFEFPDINDADFFDRRTIIIDVDSSRVESAFDVIERRFGEIQSRARSGPPLKFVDLDFDDNFRKSLELDSDAMKRVGDRFREIREEFSDGFDIPRIDLPFDEGRLNNFFRRFKSGLNDTNEETQNWAGRMRSQFNRLGDDIGPNGPLGKALDGLTAKLRNLGSTASLPHIGRLGATLGLLSGAIVASLPFIQDAGSAILAYVTGLVAQVGFLATALGGVGVAAAAAIGGAVTAALPIVLAFKSETEALLDFKDSLAAAGEEFLRIGTATQQTLLPALDEALFTLGDLVPIFSEFGLFVGRAVGNYAKLATGILVGEEAQGRFQAILQSSLRILDILLPTIINFGDILSGLWVAAIPAAERFAGSLGDMVSRWTDMINVGLRTGELTEKFDLWYDRAAILGSALSNLSGALFDIFEVGATSADGVFRRFDDWAQRFRDFTESEVGQNKLALIFDNALAVMREVNAIAADLFDGIFGRLAEVGGVDSMVAALQRFRDIIPEIQEFWADALETIDRVVRLFASNVWEKITEAWEEMAEPLGRLGEQFLILLDVMNESGAFDVFLDLMRILTDTLSTLLAIPGFGTFIAYFIAFNGALKVASLVLSPFLRLFGGFASLLVNLVRGAAGAQMVGLAGGLQKLATGIKAVAAANAVSTAGDFTKLGAQAAGSAGGIGKVVTALSGVGGLVPVLGIATAALAIGGTAFFVHQQRAQRWQQEIRQATEAIGLLNDGLNITVEGVTKYIDEFSRFESHDQIDDLERLGLSVSELGTSIAEGTLSYREFADRALITGEVFFSVNGVMNDQINSLSALQREYSLTDDELTKLAKGENVYKDGVSLIIDGNDSLIDSFVELNKVIGAAAKESIDEFVLNAQNVRLLGSGFLNDLKKDFEDIDDEDAAERMSGAQDALAAAAIKSSAAIKGLSDATRDQIREQSLFADGTVDVVKENQLLTDALARQSKQILDDLSLFASVEFDNQFLDAKLAALDFVDVVSTIKLPSVGDIGIDELVSKFPEAVTATDNLFRALEDMPADAFNATATAIGVDAGNLREAMEGAKQAIIDLQNQAIESLPSIGELLDDATSTDGEGEQIFNKEGFVKGIKDRERETREFALRLAHIREKLGDEAAIQAAQLGPQAAKSLSEVAGSSPDALKEALSGMETAEAELSSFIASKLGPGIRTKYAEQAGLLGGDYGASLAAGLNSDATLEALKGASIDALNVLAQGFRGHFEISTNGELKFIHTGTFARTRKRLTPGQQRSLFMADGGFVDAFGVGGVFSRSFGTDTVPAMLTPGEYVNTAATVDRLGVNFFDALNKGGTPAVPVGSGGTAIDASGWTIVAPTPEESGRQLVSRFRSLSFLLGGG